MKHGKLVRSLVLFVFLTAAMVPASALAAGSGAPKILFAADRAQLQPGECTKLSWNVVGGFAVVLDGQQVSHTGSRQVCPAQNQVHALGVDLGDRMEWRELAIIVSGAAPAPGPQPQPLSTQPVVQIDFRADQTQLAPGGCTTLRWDVEHAKQVFLDGKGVVGHSSKNVCPAKAHTYVLHIVHSAGTTDRKITVHLNGGGSQPAPGPEKTGVDLAVTDLYPDKLPQGYVWVRVTNHGPATLTNAKIELKCNAQGNPLNGQKPWSHVESPWQRSVSLNPGQTVALKTNIVLNTANYQYSVTCAVSPPSQGAVFSDPNSSNNNYSESIVSKSQPPAPGPFQANVAVTDLFAKQLRGGQLFARITNHGPGTLRNAKVQLSCEGAGWQGQTPVVIKRNSTQVLNLTPGQTSIHDTGIAINLDQYNYYEMNCRVQAGFTSNNSYSESIP